MDPNISLTEEWVKSWRAQFPALAQKIQGKKFAYLDSAATTLKPWPVIERVSRFLTYETANVHRGAYRLSQQATENFERARQSVTEFLGATQAEEVIFTRGTTESVNFLAYQLMVAENKLGTGDAILVTESEHHSNYLPWQALCRKQGWKFLVLPVAETGLPDWSLLPKLLTEHRVRLFAFSPLSNVIGYPFDVPGLVQIVRQHSLQTLIFVDAAQWVSFAPTRVKDWDVDFLAFSGHKLFGPYGVGVLYLRLSHASHMEPFLYGGGMVDYAGLEESRFLESPFRFEAGTPNIEGVLGLGAAVETLKSLSWQALQEHESALKKRLWEFLHQFPFVRILGPKEFYSGPILSMSFSGAHASDVAELLGQENVYVRAGHHCAQPLHRAVGVSHSLRVSFSVYNDESDVERFEKAFLQACDILGLKT
ncbi:MAG: aminotransferase class V-fold PLP-dependent enzyme [Bdellovibrionaceae bacterium]|jgi:cysteine desulfurase/selenocysteine lyase|nr:aminotransferase class V-fold PLP-dependent enzyme [Pseudobdellovibrionaceae bacterium]